MIRLLIIPNDKNNFKPLLLRKIAILCYTIILATVNILPGVIPGFLPQATSKAWADSITSERLIQLANEERRKYGLNELNANINLTTAAYSKANDMLTYQYWDHYGPDSTTNSPWYFIHSSGYNYIYAGENLAKGFRTSEGVHQAWMASPTHRGNILSGNYQDIGIAVVTGNLNGQVVTLVVQMFGNLTNEVVPGVEVDETTYQSGNEQGQIKSIKITYPESSSTINDPQTRVNGEVEGDISQYTLFLYENETEFAKTDSTEKNWSFEGNTDWTQGEHTVVAKAVTEGNEVMIDSTFVVDSDPPAPIENSLKAVLYGDTWKVSVLLDDPEGQAVVICGSKSYPMKLAMSGSLETEISNEDISATVKLILSDEVGNISEIDISDEFPNADNGNVLGAIAGRIGVSDSVNLFLGLFIFTLLVINIVYLQKEGRLNENLQSVMFVGLWLTIIMFAIFMGFSGEVII